MVEKPKNMVQPNNNSTLPSSSQQNQNTKPDMQKKKTFLNILNTYFKFQPDFNGREIKI